MSRKPSLVLIFCLFCGIVLISAPAASGQKKVRKSTARAVSKKRAAAPKVKKTSDIAPLLADVEIPGASGVLVETLRGKPIIDSFSDAPFNPASNAKIATAFAVLKAFGPEYRISTNVWTDGAVDPTTGTLIGNLFISGKDPLFSFANAITIANELNKLGIKSVSGDLIVADGFSINLSNSTAQSANSLFATLVPSSRPEAASRSWDIFQGYSGIFGDLSVPGVTFGGAVSVRPLPEKLTLLFSHESAPIKETLKFTLCYSNNFVADRLGDLVGGPKAVEAIVEQGASIQEDEFNLQTASGLGMNRVTPRAMMKLLRALRLLLMKSSMSFADIMPVAGVDEGTLAGRFADGLVKGSVIGKTGTLGLTDSGVSSLAGEISTQDGPVLFVIFNQRGSVPRFRNFQNYYVSLIQGQFGGARPVPYDAMGLEARIAKTRISHPAPLLRSERIF